MAEIKKGNSETNQPSPAGRPEDRIRERAYQIWQSEGQPSGQHERHWFQAEEELSQGQQSKATQERGPASAATKSQKPERKSKRKNSDNAL
jgi:DUF2934 family protein